MKAVYDMCQTREVELFDFIQEHLDGVPCRGVSFMKPSTVAALPVMHGETIVGCIFVVLSPALDSDGLLPFLKALAKQISTSASMVISYETEVQSECAKHDTIRSDLPQNSDDRERRASRARSR
jgi:hypothetical protein